MTSLGALWLAILVATVLIFLASSLIHMALPWHKSDFPKSPREAEVLDALRPIGLPPGDYFMPRATSGAEMKSPGFVEAMKRGPVVLMTVMPNGVFTMGATFVQWILFIAVTTTAIAWIAGTVLPPASPPRLLFHFTFLVTFVAWAVAIWPLSIWYRRSWSLALKGTLDAAIYGAITAGAFMWLWPR